MLLVVCCINFVRSMAMEPAATVRRLSTSYVTDARADLRRAYVSYSQKCRAAPFSLVWTLASISLDCTA